MSTAVQLLSQTRRWIGSWSWLKKGLSVFTLLIFLTSSFLYLTPLGLSIREFLAETVITTQHRDWAWIFVGSARRDDMVRLSHELTTSSAVEKQDNAMINHEARKKRNADELISSVKEVNGKFWKGKLIEVYDPTTIRVVTPHKAGEGERISSMSKRIGAVAGINGGGFIDPDGLGNGFAPIGLIMSDYQPIYTDTDDDTQQNIIGITEEGTLLVGMYSLNELRMLNAKEAVSFLAPRLVANGGATNLNGDGGWGRAPRTAVGQKADGTIIFLAIDGRSATSLGATLKEVQDILLAEGAINAGMMDGGASTELVINHEVVTNPSSRYGERRLPSGFLVLDEPDSYKADRVWDGITKINAGGAFDHPDFLREQEELKRRALLNPTPKPSVTPSETPQTSHTPSPTPTPSQSPTTPKPSTTPGNAGGGGTVSPAPTPTPSGTGTPKPSVSPTPGGTGGGSPTPGTGGGTSGTGSPSPTPSGSGTATATPKPSVTPSSTGGAPAGTNQPTGSPSTTGTTGTTGTNTATPPKTN
ncbi:phosphodiester glycosidase family protein [Paenibacillus koleovorans]|uniref:phosphodiester glycosidase family protein n=1 Tax=Paenibacillus koleovorans TaxID=121608 RepID=UPI000FD81A5C|nr:phosphodiester glycosidase family protein [Paenibacillus koleovorans]